MENEDEITLRKLSSPVLVLNKGWTAIGTTSLRNAIVDISRGAALGVCTESFLMYEWEDWIASENSPVVAGYIKASNDKLVPAPDFIVLARYDKVHKKTLFLGGKALYIRDNYTCRYCKKRFRASELSIDHVKPRSKGGPNSWENCVAACIPCNQKKADKTLKEMGLPPLAPKPGPPKWNPVGHISPNARLESWKKVLRQG